MKPKSKPFPAMMILVFSLAFTVISGEAQTLSTEQKDPPKAPVTNNNSSTTSKEPEKPKYTGEMVEKNMENIHRLIMRGKDDPHAVSAMQFNGFAKSYDYFANYAEIEKTTGITRDWFFKMKKILFSMYEPREMMVTAEANGDKEKYEKSKIEYEKALEQYMDLYKNPDKVKKKKGEKTR